MACHRRSPTVMTTEWPPTTLSSSLPTRVLTTFSIYAAITFRRWASRPVLLFSLAPSTSHLTLVPDVIGTWSSLRTAFLLIPLRLQYSPGLVNLGRYLGVQDV